MLILAGLLFGDAAPAKAQPVPASDALAEVGMSAGVRGWQTTYRKSDAVGAYGLTGGYIPLRWLEIAAALDHARRTSNPANLRITNSETWLAVGPRFSLWFDFVRLFAETALAGVLRTVSYHDDAIARSARLSAGFAVGAGFTIAVANRVGVQIRGDWRHRDDQSNLFVGMDVTWFFRPSRPR